MDEVEMKMNEMQQLVFSLNLKYTNIIPERNECKIEVIADAIYGVSKIYLDWPVFTLLHLFPKSSFHYLLFDDCVVKRHVS